MNQKGEITFFSCFMLFVLMSIVLMCGLELRRSFHLLEKRTQLFLCVKETKGELNEFMKFMGRTNWAIKNINKVSLVMMFIPGLQAAGISAKKTKKLLERSQNLRLISYLKTLGQLKSKGCPLDPRMLITPFKIGAGLLQRNSEGVVLIREKKWTYYFLSKPYLLNLNVHAVAWESVYPKLKYVSEEKGGKLSSLLSSSY